MNPWQLIPYQDYEKHMAHPEVQQLQCLNAIIRNKTALYKPKSVAVYGCCTGNGFEHFEDVKTIYAIDINAGYLKVCEERYPQLRDSLHCIAADVDKDIVPIAPGSVDLIFCHLFLEYVDLQKAISGMSAVLSPNGTINIVIQKNENVGFVSDTGITSLKLLAPVSNDVNSDELLALTQLLLKSKQDYPMPNGKILQSFDFDARLD